MDWGMAQEILGQHIGKKVQIRSANFSVVGILEKDDLRPYRVRVGNPLSDSAHAHVTFSASDVSTIGPNGLIRLKGSPQ